MLQLVSSNLNKIKEAQNIIGFPIQPIQLDLDEIQSLDLIEIVTKKAQEAFNIVKKPLIVDDVGLFIEAWDGFPGPFIKYLLKSGNTERLMKMLANETNRKAIASAAIGFHNGSQIITFIGERKGSIATTPRGENGFGFDPIFIPENSSKTNAELTREEKNKISHRYLALKKFKNYLEENKITFS